jgi:hypothetical protein
MPTTIPQPLILDDASLKISDDGTTAGLTELACVATHIELSPDVSVTTVDTFCGSTDYPGVVKWSLIATLVQSFDPAATEEVLSAALALDGPTAFEIVPYRSQPISATNPAWSGEVVPKPYAPINGDAGDASTVELEWSVVGAPAKRITLTAAAAEIDLYAMTRAELDEQATALGLNPPDYSTKDEEIAAIQAAQGQTTPAS